MTDDQISPRFGPIDQEAAAMAWALSKMPKQNREWAFRSFESLRLGLTQVNYWRLLPYGYWSDVNGRAVIFDRNYCPIIGLSCSNERQLVDPLERVDWATESHFYEDASAPYIANSTLPLVLNIAAAFGLEREIQYRWRISDFGRHDKGNWGSRWRFP